MLELDSANDVSHVGERQSACEVVPVSMRSDFRQRKYVRAMFGETSMARVLGLDSANEVSHVGEAERASVCVDPLAV